MLGIQTSPWYPLRRAEESLMRKILVPLLALAGACTTNSSGASLGNETEATALPPIKVDLPPPPSFAASDIPEKTAEGDWSIRGVRKNHGTTINQKVKVK